MELEEEEKTKRMKEYEKKWDVSREAKKDSGWSAKLQGIFQQLFKILKVTSAAKLFFAIKYLLMCN